MIAGMSPSLPVRPLEQALPFPQSAPAAGPAIVGPRQLSIDGEPALDTALLKDGAPEAFALCYRLHARHLLTVALRFTGSLSDAEDVVHDVFAGLAGSLSHYEERGQFGAWLTRLTIHTSLMHRRRERVRTHRGEESLDHLAAPTVDGDPVAAARVMRALRALTPALRHVFVLRAVHDYSHAEISEALGIPTNTSEVRLHRAVRQLRELLEDVR